MEAPLVALADAVLVLDWVNEVINRLCVVVGAAAVAGFSAGGLAATVFTTTGFTTSLFEAVVTVTGVIEVE